MPQAELLRQNQRAVRQATLQAAVAVADHVSVVGRVPEDAFGPLATELAAVLTVEDQHLCAHALDLLQRCAGRWLLRAAGGWRVDF